MYMCMYVYPRVWVCKRCIQGVYNMYVGEIYGSGRQDYGDSNGSDNKMGDYICIATVYLNLLEMLFHIPVTL